MISRWCCQPWWNLPSTKTQGEWPHFSVSGGAVFSVLLFLVVSCVPYYEGSRPTTICLVYVFTYVAVMCDQSCVCWSIFDSPDNPLLPNQPFVSVFFFPRPVTPPLLHNPISLITSPFFLPIFPRHPPPLLSSSFLPFPSPSTTILLRSSLPSHFPVPSNSPHPHLSPSLTSLLSLTIHPPPIFPLPTTHHSPSSHLRSALTFPFSLPPSPEDLHKQCAADASLRAAVEQAMYHMQSAVTDALKRHGTQPHSTFAIGEIVRQAVHHALALVAPDTGG